MPVHTCEPRPPVRQNIRLPYVTYVLDIDPTSPYRFTLLNTPLVIWWDPNAAAWRVFKDVCPHRLVPLSEGRVNKQGLLECGYHGWGFSGEGKCEVIPQGGNNDSPRACATAYPCAVRQGLLFVKPKPLPNPIISSKSAAAVNGSGSSTSLLPAVADESDIPIVEELEDPNCVAQDTWRDIPYDWSTLMENVLDASHVPFTHHKSISNRNIVGDYLMRLTAPVDESGFKGVWQTGPRAGALGPQSCMYKAPCYMQHKIDSAAKRGMDSMVVVYAVPTMPGHCRLINRNTIRFVNNNSWAAKLLRHIPGFLVHIGTQVPLEDDQIFLHLGEPEYATARAAGKTPSQAYYMPSRADSYVLGFRTWLDKFGGGGPWGQIDDAFVNQMPPRLTKHELLDRYDKV
eukprot:jgi/Chrzof1/4765/Cz14g25130.t1_PAO4[v5.2]